MYNTVNKKLGRNFAQNELKRGTACGEFWLRIYGEFIVSILAHHSPPQLRIVKYRDTDTFVCPYLGGPFVRVTLF